VNPLQKSDGGNAPRVSVRYGKNVTDVDISKCVTESVSVNLMDKSDGGNAP
jgi:hypothetical protein